jgi:hypothetical protein
LLGEGGEFKQRKVIEAYIRLIAFALLITDTPTDITGTTGMRLPKHTTRTDVCNAALDSHSKDSVHDHCLIRYQRMFHQITFYAPIDLILRENVIDLVIPKYDPDLGGSLDE